MLYFVGGRGYSRGTHQGLRTASFVAGLVTIVIALDSPIDTYADQLFWVHMLQHVLLLTVAPPLILLGRAVAANVARAAARGADDDRAHDRQLGLDRPDPRARPPVAGVDPVQRDVRALAHPEPPTT